MKKIVLDAEVRRSTGKGAARELRRQGRIPGIFYSPKGDNIPLIVDPRELERILSRVAGANVMIDLNIKGNGRAQKRKVMIK